MPSFSIAERFEEIGNVKNSWKIPSRYKPSAVRVRSASPFRREIQNSCKIPSRYKPPRLLGVPPPAPSGGQAGRVYPPLKGDTGVGLWEKLKFNNDMSSRTGGELA